eukprot:TRINITY_DN778_c0_g1_i1.p1 TRINITY_DN778_c0_g1~~TRINITY_DN778_c0_g1_i1.p1  ORF type:complete len:316 (+),score=138.24 TRINITY_DN778_c0_g1_i1:61-1008(+)
MRLSVLTLAVLCVAFLGSPATASNSQAVGSAAISPFNPSTGLEYLFYAYAAYCPASALTTWSCQWCHSGFTVMQIPTSRDGGFSFVGFDAANKTIVVSFRGSTNLQDWIVDLNSIVKVPYKSVPGAEVGKGFNDMYNQLQPAIFSTVQSLVKQNPTYQVVVTGHSLGAALSVLCAVDLVTSGTVKNVTVYNYGCPRVGNQAFSNYYHSYVPITYRVVNGHDIVPHLPLESLGFYHVPMEVWENPSESNTYQKCDPNNGEDPTCSDSQTLDLSAYDHLHYMNQYETCSGTDFVLPRKEFLDHSFSLKDLKSLSKLN